MLRRFVYPVVFLIATICAQGQQPCELPHFTPATAGSNMFTAEQSDMLGDLITEQLASEYKVLHNDALTSHLQSMADTMAGNVDPTLHVRVAIVDRPIANAFTFPGGRIFFTRKLIGFVQNEDELAAVLAHEIGHVVTRDGERTVSYYFRMLLGVTSVNNRAELTEDFHRVLESTRRKDIPAHPEGSEKEQLHADQVAVWTMARAGYKPQAFSDFWDRFSETKGKTGNWLGDVFGSTKPEQKRLRMVIKEADKLPPSCIAKHGDVEQQFKTWQSAVMVADAGGRAESLHAVATQYKLEPRLRPDLDYLKFSPDGKWIVAQDETSVYVLSREPLGVRFQVHAPDAYRPVFSPDSDAVSFYDENLRVQRWSIVSGKREFLFDVSLGPTKSCPDSALSPDGRSLACIDSDLTLRIIDVATANPVFEKKNVAQDSKVQLGMFILSMHGVRQGSFKKAFSPDGRYFLAARGSNAVAVDLQDKRIIPLPSSLQEHLSGGFSFQGFDKIVIVNADSPERSVIRRFPSGEVITELPLGKQAVEAPTHGDEFVFLRPIVKYPLGVMDVKTKKIVGIRVAAYDMYDRLCVSEGRAGEVTLVQFQSATAIASIDLPPTKLARLRTAALSPDFKKLAISERARGAVWNLETGQRLGLMRGYSGAFLDADGSMYLDFPQQGQMKRTIVHMDAHWSDPQPVFVVDNPESQKEVEEKLRQAQSASTTTLVGYTQQHGQFVVVEKPESARQGEWDRNIELTVYDVRTGNKAWSRRFPRERPFVSANSYYGTMTLMWVAWQGAAKDILSGNPALKKQLSDMKTEKGGVCLIEILDLATGGLRGHVLVDTGSGSFVPRFVSSAGDYVLFTDTQNRVVVYSLSSGQMLGRVFGVYATVTPVGKLLAVGNAAGQLTIYELPSMQKRDQPTFAGEVVYQRFTPDGKSLLVITDDHVAYLMVVAGGIAATQP